MKKRIFVFAVAVVVLLSLSASAWGASYQIKSIIQEYIALYDVDNRQSEDLSIRIRTRVPGQNGDNYASTNAVTLRVQASGYNDTVTGLKLKSDSARPQIGQDDTAYFDLDVNKEIYDLTLTGKIKASCTLTVTATLLNKDGGKAGLMGNATEKAIEDSVTITLSEKDGLDERNDAFGQEPYSIPGSDSSSELDNSSADPANSNLNWDGLSLPLGTGKQGDSKNKPKIATSRLAFTGTGYSTSDKTLKSGKAAEFKIEIDGPTPKVDVYISYKDAKKLWPLSKDSFISDANNIRLIRANIENYKLPFRVTSYDIKTDANQNKLTSHSITIAYNGAKVAYKGFPLTVSASNLGTVDSKGNSKPVTKTFKIDIVSSHSTPQWITSDGVPGEKLTNPDTGRPSKNADNIPVHLDYFGRKVFTTSYTVSCDPPYTIEAKGNKDGITATVYQPVLNRYGEVITPGYVVIGGSFDKAKVEDKDGNSKESKVTVTLKAAGSVKNTSFKSTVTGKVSPYFPANKIVSKDNAKYLTGIKSVQAGKVPNVKFAAKGSKTITYSIDSDSLAKLNAVNLSFDCAKGSVIAMKGSNNKALPSRPTLSGDSFQSIDIAVTANNGTGKKAAVHAEVAVTGAKPALTKASGTVTIQRGEVKSGDKFIISCDVARAAVSRENTDNKIMYSFADEASQTKLEALGLVLEDGDRNYGVIRVSDDTKLKATKGTKINLLLDNFGMQNRGSVNVVIADPAPVITGTNTINLATASQNAAGTIKLSLKENPTDGAKTKWSLKTKPTSDWGATLKAASDGNTADFTVKLKKALTAGSKVTASIVAKNPNSKLTSEVFTITIKAGTAANTTQARPGQVGAAVLGNADGTSPQAEAESESESEEAVLTFGAVRTEADLTAVQKAFIQSRGYTVIAVLPEVSASAEGQAELPVELYEDAPVGAKLVWLAFPQNAEECDDDKIADFYDEEGAEIECVPSGRNITVAAWLRAGVKYQPVIAAEN